MRNCNSNGACEVHVRMHLAARGPTQAAHRRLGQLGVLAHANNDGIGLGGPQPRPRPEPCAARSPDPECMQPVVLMMRMRPFWVNGGPFLIKMLW